ncbi:MAG: 5-formyltetrahydrofolate cyclo-ligase [Bacillota bacterium]
MKRKIRQQIIRLRMEMSLEEVKTKSQAIMDRLLGEEIYRKARMMMVYVDFRHEVETGGIIQNALEGGKTVAVPVCEPRETRLVPSKVMDYPGDLAPGTWGILEPKPDKLHPVEPVELDLVLVPGVAFDVKGNRLGYGGGYYDRFLTRLRPEAMAVALAFEEQILLEVYPEAYDQRVHAIITDQRTIICK